MDYLKYFNDIKHQVDTLHTFAKIHHRRSTTNEDYEDCFLRLKEKEGFALRFDRPEHGFVCVIMTKFIDKDTVEDTFNEYLKELKHIKYRLDKKSFETNFSIELNGKAQSDLNPKTHKNDDFKFKGIGDKEGGHDDRGLFITIPDNKVAVKIKFYIV